MAKFVQWNVRGLQANREDLSLLISSIKPTVLALQETNIGNDNIIIFFAVLKIMSSIMMVQL